MPTPASQITIPPKMRQGKIDKLNVSAGTSDNVVSDVGVAFNQATLNNNFREIADKLNAILDAVRNASITAP